MQTCYGGHKKNHSKWISLWGAWYGSQNVGDQALLLTITDILGQLIENVRFTVFTTNPQHVNNYTSRESLRDIQAIHNRRHFYKLVYSLAKSDLFIFGGGVPFYQEKGHVLAMGLLIGLVRLFRTPYMTWTVSSQIVNDPTAKRVFRWVLDGAQAITYRDEHTGRLFKSCGVHKPMCLAGDPGFLLEPADPEIANALIARAGERKIEKPLVALTPRTLHGYYGEAQKHYNLKTQTQYDQEIACYVAVLDWLWEHNFQPIMVPMNIVAPDDDRIAARRIIRESRHGVNVLLVNEEVRPSVAPVIYQQCQASFVARVHGSVTSFIGGCPVMMYAFAPKHIGIMQSMRLSENILKEEIATPDAAVEMMSDMLENREQLRILMRERLAGLRQEALIPAKMAVQILRGRTELLQKSTS